MEGVPQLAAFLAEVRTAVSTGGWVEGAKPPDGEKPTRRIDAELVVTALLEPGGIPALRLRHVTIVGSVGLAGASLAPDLSLEHCEVEGGVELSGWEIGALRIVATHIHGALRAEELTVDRSMILDGSTADAGVFAPNARVGRRLSCNDLTIPRGTDAGGRRRAFSLEGASVGGRLSAIRLDANGEVNLNGATIDGELDLTDANVHGVERSLRIENVHVKGSAFVKSTDDYGRFRAEGAVSFAGSEFAGDLNCTGLNVEPVGRDDEYEGGAAERHNGPDAKAGSDDEHDHAAERLDARNVKVGGECFLNHGTIVGGVLLTAAEIHGQLNLSGLKLTGTPVASLDARSMRIGTDVWLDNCFESTSAVILDRCTIGGNVNAVAGHFGARTDDGARYAGLALSLASATIEGSLVLADEEWTAKRPAWNGVHGFAAAGTVVLTYAHVRRRLELSGGVFDGGCGDALRAEGIRVDADAFLGGRVGADSRSTFRAVGPVLLTRGVVAGSLDLTDAHIAAPLPPARSDARAEAGASRRDEHAGARAEADSRDEQAGGVALDASLMRVGDRLVLRKLQLDGALSLAGTHVGTLSDDDSYWRERDETLTLDEFSYDFLERDELGWRYGREWLAHQARYRAQPYLQLAKVERDTGRGREARRISMERHRARLARRPPPYTGKPAQWLGSRAARLGDRALGALVGWGYAPWRLAPVWAVMLAAAVLVFHWAGAHDEMRPSDVPTVVTGRTPSSSRCLSDYPCFESFTYSLDDVLPIVDLQQRDRWYVDTRSASGRWVGVASLIFTLLGWVFATLLAASFTNVLRRE